MNSATLEYTEYMEYMEFITRIFKICVWDLGFGPHAWALGTLGPKKWDGPLAWALGTLGPKKNNCI